MTGKKYDEGKLRFSLMPLLATESMNRVLEFGAAKYGVDNWREVEDGERRYFDAAMRHLMAWMRGDPIDDESGLPHLAHAMCCIAFLLEKEIGKEIRYDEYEKVVVRDTE